MKKHAFVLVQALPQMCTAAIIGYIYMRNLFIFLMYCYRLNYVMLSEVSRAIGGELSITLTVIEGYANRFSM